MRSIYLAVFGHYDSRGGTTGMPLPDNYTPTDVQGAITAYNRVFAWEEMLAEYRANPEVWQWDPTKPGPSPGENDFMFIARLWFKGELPDGDLEESGIVVQDMDSEWELDETHGKASVLDVIRQRTYGEPIELEFVSLGRGRYTSESEYEEALKTEHGVPWEEWAVSLTEQLDKSHELSVPNWNDDAFGFIIGTRV